MDPAAILEALGASEDLPVAAILAARADRGATVPALLQAIEQYLAADGAADDRNSERALFFAFHLLGEWRETSAYRPLVRLLRAGAPDSAFPEWVLDTAHRVLAAVFDGDPQPLYDLIRDPAADEGNRAAGCEALAIVTRLGALPRQEAARFLRACFFELEPLDHSFVWQGWQSAIALLGLEELKPIVQQAFIHGFISPNWLTFADFEADLRHAVEHPDAPPLPEHGIDITLFGDTLEEFAGLYLPHPDAVGADEDQHFSDEEMDAAIEYLAREQLRDIPATNAHKGVGRNDPCPCGSGKKFKKCCLNAEDGAVARPAA